MVWNTPYSIIGGEVNTVRKIENGQKIYNKNENVYSFMSAGHQNRLQDQDTRYLLDPFKPKTAYKTKIQYFNYTP